ncbi:tyrosine-type recombinase/integrase [Polaribacter sp. OB-PA-B3]
MAKVTFKLREGKGKSAKIQLFFNYGTGKRFRFSTGLSILNLKNWDVDKMRIKNVASEIYKNEVNNRLTEIQNCVEKLNISYVTKGLNLDNEILKSKVSVLLNRKKNIEKEVEQRIEIIQFYKWFIDNYSVNPMISTGKPMGSGTARTYRNAYRIIKEYNDSIEKLSFDKIDLNFYQSFLDFLNERDYSLNYIGTQIKILKTIMNSGFERNQHTNLEFKKSAFKIPKEEVYNIYLNEDELQKIFKLDFSDYKPKKASKDFLLTKEKLENARDLFLISSNTGLRVSDFNRLTKENLINEGGVVYISIITTKNSKNLTIPVNSNIQSILDKNGGEPPHKMPEQHINYCLKELGELAEINDDVKKEITRGGSKVVITYKKYELISNHTGRRSFCTNAYKSGMPTIDIMAISGHSTEEVFYNYIKVDDIERAKKISKHNFFR